jgi:hypothetical protein
MELNNGMKWNEMEWNNGMELNNGMKWNEIEWNASRDDSVAESNKYNLCVGGCSRGRGFYRLGSVRTRRIWYRYRRDGRTKTFHQ